MIEDLVLHVGDCKTGSTSIQAALNQRLWTGAVPDVHFPRQGTHNDLAAPFFKRRVKAQKTKRMAALARDLRAATAPLAVVSAEHFEFADPAAVAEAFQRHLPQLQDRIRVIAYVRPHADRLVSSFAQHLKQRAVTETRMDDLLDRYVKTGRLHYAPRFSRWKTAFGDRFTLRPMVADTLYQGDVVADFFQYLFHGADVRLRPGTDANVGLSLQDLALILALHARLDPSGSAKSTPKLKGLIPLLIRSLPRPVDPIKLRLHRSLAERVVDTYRADAAELDAMFFAGQPMTQALHAARTRRSKRRSAWTRPITWPPTP